MAKPRNSLAELERLLRVAEIGGTNLGEYLAEAGEDLAQRLGVEAQDLRALVHLPDEDLARHLRPHFERRAEHRASIRADAVQRLALAAAEQLAATAVWRDEAAVLDIRVLLGELLVDTTQKHVLLDATSFTSRFQVSVPRSMLVNVARVLGARPDIGAWVDEAGLHFRWNQGRGGLNFISQCVPAQDRDTLLCVIIPPPYVERPRPRLAATRAWFSEVLAEMALA
jgi:hypothetical protein